MIFSKWMREQHTLGTSVLRIAEEALKWPPQHPGGSVDLTALVSRLASLLDVHATDIYIIGSARYGFSLHDGASFDPAFSDLGLAVVDSRLYARCDSGVDAPPGSPRSPVTDLPMHDRIPVRRALDALSRSIAREFAYLSVTVFPDLVALQDAEASRISQHLGLPGDSHSSPDPTDANPGRLNPILEAVAKAGLPQFMAPVSASHPGNASPWLASTSEFAAVFGRDEVRQALLDTLERAFRLLSKIVKVQCSLVGGSFVDLSNPAPKDVDIVVFYQASPEPSFDLGRSLQRLSRRFQLDRIDMRFVPCDSQPWLLVKLTSFFTTLYQSHRSDAKGCNRGLVLLVPNGPSFDAVSAANNGESDGG